MVHAMLRVKTERPNGYLALSGLHLNVGNCSEGWWVVVTFVWTRCAQVDDKKDLEYQAGQDDESAADQGKEPQEKDAAGQKDKRAPEEAPAQEQEEEEQGETGEDGGTNEDTEEGYEQRQFAAPQVSMVQAGKQA